MTGKITRNITGRDIKAEYCAWVNMLARCYNKKHKQYHNYGGRPNNPILVCDEWKNDFEQFLLDVGRRPKGTSRTDEWSLDRIDNDKGYSKENCKWSQRTEQQRNQSKNRSITYNGVTKLIVEWAEEFRIPYGRFAQRLKLGFTMEQASVPTLYGPRNTPNPRKRRTPNCTNPILTEDMVLAIRASDEPIKDLALKYGVHRATIRDAYVGRSWKHLPGARERRKAYRRENSTSNAPNTAPNSPSNTAPNSPSNSPST